MKTLKIAAMIAFGSVSSAHAQETLFDARQPTEVVVALQNAGFKAELAAGTDGAPLIRSAANGQQFTIHFYDCEAKVDCTSFQFFSWYKKEPLFTIGFAND